MSFQIEPKNGRLDILVKSVWAQSLPSVPFDPTRAWRDVGMDSLKALGFVLRLEQALGRKIAFDGMDPDSTAGDLLRLLAESSDSRSAPMDRRARMFFVVGLGGDDQAQAEFRNTFRREVAFDVLAIDVATTPSRVLGDVAARADLLVREVIERQPSGPVRLAGYSLGGLVAQEMARRLEAEGRVVAFLAVLDGLLVPQFWSPPPGKRRQLLSAHRRQWLKNTLFQVAGPALRRLNMLELARRIVWSGWLRDQPMARDLNRKLLRAWGQSSILDWRPEPCKAPTLLITSDAFATFSSIEVWSRICPDMRVAEVPGDHYHFLRPPAVAACEADFLEVLAGSIGG